MSFIDAQSVHTPRRNSSCYLLFLCEPYLEWYFPVFRNGGSPERHVRQEEKWQTNPPTEQNWKTRSKHSQKPAEVPQIRAVETREWREAPRDAAVDRPSWVPPATVSPTPIWLHCPSWEARLPPRPPPWGFMRLLASAVSASLPLHQRVPGLFSIFWRGRCRGAAHGGWRLLPRCSILDLVGAET